MAMTVRPGTGKVGVRVQSADRAGDVSSTEGPALLDPVRIGVVGLRHGARHVAGFQQAFGSTVSAVCDLDLERGRQTARSAAPGCLVTADFEDVLASPEVDAVVVSVPNDRHAEFTERALQAGKHVAVEKPMATSGAVARVLVELARERSLILAALHDFRVDPAHWAARELVRDGVLGEVYFARSIWVRRDNAPGPPATGDWYLQRARAGGGVLLDLGTHRIDLALWMLGFPAVQSLTAATSRRLLERRADNHGDVEDTAVGMLQLGGGAVLEVETSFLGHLPKAEDVLLEIRGSQASLRVENVGDSYRSYRLILLDEQDGTHRQISFPVLAPPPSLYEDFAHAVSTGSAPVCPGAEAASVAVVIDQMYDAAGQANSLASAPERR